LGSPLINLSACPSVDRPVHMPRFYPSRVPTSTRAAR
jgi:hypothetical protein